MESKNFHQMDVMCPVAYRGMDYIKEAVEDTVEITKILRSVYNYKGGIE